MPSERYLPETFLLHEQRAERRTIADALHVLRERTDFGEGDEAELIVGRFELRSDRSFWLVHVAFSPDDGRPPSIVTLPPCNGLTAIQQGASQRGDFDADGFHGARVSASGIVRLVTGTFLRAVEVRKVSLNEPSSLDWRILHLTVRSICAEGHVYRNHRGELASEAEEIHDYRWVDCGKLTELNLPLLKQIRGYIAANDPTLRRLSEQKVADALRRFGMRMPIRRSRRNES